MVSTKGWFLGFSAMYLTILEGWGEGYRHVPLLLGLGLDFAGGGTWFIPALVNSKFGDSGRREAESTI